MASYINARLESRDFVYDLRGRLHQVIYHLNGGASETVTMDYDEVDQLLQLTERNGDVNKMTYDVSGRMVTEERTSASNQPVWKYQASYDDNGNRLSLSNVRGTQARYGSARYGVDQYSSSNVIFDTPADGFDAHNRRVAQQDSAANETRFACGVTSPTTPANSCRRSEKRLASWLRDCPTARANSAASQTA